MKKGTKILSLGILFLFVCTLSLSAQKCKFSTQKDKVTGKIKKWNSIKFLPKGTINGSQISFIKTDTTYHFEMFIISKGNFREPIQKGDPIVIKLSNEEEITLTSIDEFKPTSQILDGLVTYRYKGLYEIDAVLLKKIAEFQPTIISIFIGDKVYTDELSSKTGLKFSEGAACILQ